MSRKIYLGDGAYYEFDGYGVSLTAENGVSVSDRIYLEPDVIASLLRALQSDYDRERLQTLLGLLPIGVVP